MKEIYCLPSEHNKDESKRKVAIASIMAGLELLLDERFEVMEKRIIDKILEELLLDSDNNKNV